MASHGSKTFLLDAQQSSALPAREAARRTERRHTPDQGSAARCREVLDQLLQQTVISRLRIAHGDLGAGFSAALVGDAVPSPAAHRPDQDDQVAALGIALCEATQTEVDDLVEAGVHQHGIEMLVMDIMPQLDTLLRARTGTASATMLGHWRLQEMLERLSARFQATAAGRPHGCRVLLGTPQPQRQNLPALLLAECLIRDGWDVRCECQEVHGDALAAAPATIDLCCAVAGEWFGLAMLAVDGAPAATLAADIRGLRLASCNPGLRVLVISEALSRRPDRMAKLGADAAAGDLRHACTQAARLRGLLVRCN